MVLLAMLVPMAVLVQQYALEDRLAQAALEVQATETVVSGPGQGLGAVYLDSINSDDNGDPDDRALPRRMAIGPTPVRTRVSSARTTGQARVDDVAGGAEILVPVSLGGSSALPEDTPVIRVQVLARGFGSVYRRLGSPRPARASRCSPAAFCWPTASAGVRAADPRWLARPRRRWATDRDDPCRARGSARGAGACRRAHRLGRPDRRLLEREREGVATSPTGCGRR